VTELALRSAIIVAVPEAASAVDGWRERTCHVKPSSGVPPHITILVPFVQAAEVNSSHIEDLKGLFADVVCFEFVLRATARFPEVLYLAPDPSEPFVELVDVLRTTYTDYAPYEGAIEAVVPHLTVAEGGTETLDSAELDVSRALPIRSEASTALLLEEIEPDGTRWRTRARFPFSRR
jgi:2'-5' RNA ligase